MNNPEASARKNIYYHRHEVKEYQTFDNKGRAEKNYVPKKYQRIKYG